MAVIINTADLFTSHRSLRCHKERIVNFEAPLACSVAFIDVVDIAPLSQISPLPVIITWHTFSLSPAPAHGEFGLGHRLRLLTIDTAGDLLILTAGSIS